MELWAQLLIGIGIWIVIVTVLLMALHVATKGDMPKQPRISLCPLDYRCGNNEGGGCGLYPRCLEDHEG